MSIENMATLSDNKIQEHTKCTSCNEDYIFLLKDKTRDFSIGLTTILSCLSFAEQKGAIPALPEEWWTLINLRY